MKKIIIKERNYINRYNEFIVIQTTAEIDPTMISIIARKRRKEKYERLEKEIRKKKAIINQIQIEKLNAINDREYSRLEEVWAYYMRDLRNLEKELNSIGEF